MQNNYLMETAENSRHTGVTTSRKQGEKERETD